MVTINQDKENQIFSDLHTIGIQGGVSEQLEYFENYYRIVLKSLGGKALSIESRMWEDVDSEDNPDYKEEITDEYFSVLYNLETMMPNLHSASTILTLYSFFESTLYFYCKILGDRFLESGHALPKGGILKYRLWLEKNVGVNFGPAKDSWEEINNIRQLRNLITHEFGGAYDRERIMNYINCNKHLDLDESGFGYCYGVNGGFTINEGYVAFIIDLYRTFFKDLTDGFRHLFPYSESQMKSMLEESDKEDEARCKERVESLGKNPTIRDVMEAIYSDV